MASSRWDVSFEDHDPRFQPKWTELPRDVLIDKIKGVVFGQAIGDAIGLATEFMVKSQAKKCYGKGPSGYKDIVPDFHRSRWQKGDWTDDTDQMILALMSLIEYKGRPVAQDFAQRLRQWMQKGFSELHDTGGMGIGMTTHKTLTSPKFLSDPHQVARDVWEASGCYLAPNGAVMRTSILGVANFNDLKKVVSQTRELCLVTHADPRCLASCIVVTTAIALMLKGIYNISESGQLDCLINQCCEIAEEVALDKEDASALGEFRHHVSVEKLADLKLCEHRKIGYTYKALGAGVLALRRGENYRKFIIDLIMEAGDADTNASVAGALLGCKLGYKKLPADLLDTLVHKKWLEGWLDKFLSMMALGGPAEASDKTGNEEQSSEAVEETPPAGSSVDDPVTSTEEGSQETSTSEAQTSGPGIEEPTPTAAGKTEEKKTPEAAGDGAPEEPPNSAADGAEKTPEAAANDAAEKIVEPSSGEPMKTPVEEAPPVVEMPPVEEASDGPAKPMEEP